MEHVDKRKCCYSASILHYYEILARGLIGIYGLIWQGTFIAPDNFTAVTLGALDCYAM